MAASESDLNLNGVTSDECEVSLKDCLLNYVEISVLESEKRTSTSLNLKDFYTVYLIETRIVKSGWDLKNYGLGQIWRRYSEFEQLRTYLTSIYPWSVIPPLPEKKQTHSVHLTSVDTFDPDFVDRRRACLENFLHRIASHHVISRDQVFLMFLQKEDEWKKCMKDTGYWHMAENKLKALNAVVRTRNTDVDLEEIRQTSRARQSCLNNVLRVRAKIAAKSFQVNKLCANYGKVFSEWSGIEKEMGDELQKAGHFLDSLASEIDTKLEEEEQIADQLKEYFYFESSLDGICNRREILQYELERAQDCINAKNEERFKIQEGRSSMMSRLFGSVDSEEVRECKLGQTDEKIKELVEEVREKEENLKDFKIKAMADIKDYEERKISDLQDTLEAFIKLQINHTKKNLQTWTNIKECFDSIQT